MVIGAIIAAVLGAIGVPWALAIAIGVAYFLIAARITPRSAYVGGLFGPKPRPGEIPVPSSSREMDLSAADLAEMNEQNRRQLASLAPELERELDLRILGLQYGNIGRRQGQFAAFVFQETGDESVAILTRGRAVQFATAMIAPQHDDVREVRVTFLDGQARRRAETIVDMSGAFAIKDPEDDASVAAYASTHSRSREFD